MGIRNKLMLCLLAVLFPLAAVCTFATYLINQQVTERTTSALAATHRLEAARIEQLLQSYVSRARGLASSGPVHDIFKRMDDFSQIKVADPISGTEHLAIENGFERFASIESHHSTQWNPQQTAQYMHQRLTANKDSSVAELRIVNRDNVTLGESADFTWAPADDALIERAMHTREIYFGDAFVKDDGAERLGIVSPIIGESGNVRGALILEYQLAPIIDMISKHEQMGPSSEAHIAQATMGGDAQFITPLRFDRTAAFRKIVPSESNLAINQALRSKESRVIKSLDYRGVKSFLAIQSIELTGWGLVVKVDVAETYAPVVKLRNWLLWATVASIGFVALIYLFLLIPIVNRLNKAASTAREIMGGNLTARVDVTSNDEITELATSINTLANDLEADQKKKIEVEAQLRYQAAHDELTGLLNRKHANQVIEQLAHDRSTEHSVMFLDLNGFKEINDLYGHATGDRVLSRVAQRLSIQIPNGATFARWGGDEFVVILPGASQDEATELARSLHEVFVEPFEGSVSEHNLSCSIGFATSSLEKSLDDALAEADALMYAQKKKQRSHRRKIDHSKNDLTTKAVERALEEERIEMWFQPTFQLERPGNYALVGAGAHIRLRNSQGAYVLPDEFMTDLLDTAVIRALDNRALELALRALRRWDMAGIVDNRFRLSVALSDHAMRDPRFPDLLEKRLTALELSAAQVQIELPIEPNRVDDQIIAQLRRTGLSLAINGVGSEPELLRQVPACRPSIAIIGKPTQGDTVVQPLLMNTCKQLGIGVLARCVDNRAELTQLHELGVTHFQGSLFEKPVQAVDFVSRWGQTRTSGSGKAMSATAGLRLAG